MALREARGRTRPNTPYRIADSPRASRRAQNVGLRRLFIVGVVAALALAGFFAAKALLGSHAEKRAAAGQLAQGTAASGSGVKPASVQSAASAPSVAGGSAASGGGSSDTAAGTTSAAAAALVNAKPVPDPATDQAVPVLMYHHVMPNPSNFIAISPATFDAQMGYLKSHGFHPVSISQLEEFVYTGKRLPSNPVLITFDDDRMNQLTYAVPILKKYGFTATFFVVKKWIVTSSPYFMHEAQLKQLIADGYDVQSHTANHVQIHPFKSRTTGQFTTYADMKKSYWDALDGMRVWMDSTLGGPAVTALAYPGGRINSQAEQLAKDSGYLVAFTTDSGYVTYKGQNPEALPRWNTGAKGTTLATFAAIMNGAKRAASK